MFKSQRILIAKSAEKGGHDLCRDVRSFGGEPLGPAATVGEALDLLGRMVVDGAIVDEYLQNGTVAPLVLRLRERGIPLVLLKTSCLTLEVETCQHPVKVLCAWASSFQVIRTLEAEMESFSHSTGKVEPGLFVTARSSVKW